MTLTLRAATRTDIGLRRGNNEDAMYAGRRLLAVADGMGGQVYGELASRVAIFTAVRLDEEVAAGDPLTELRDAIGDANEQIRAMISGDESLEGMGTTFTALLSAQGRLALAHVGDSRAYLSRDGEFRQISHDHSFVQELVDSGQITEEQAQGHPNRAVITRALDGRTDVDPDVGILEAREGDRYLLCSDGLSDYVSDDSIAEALQLAERGVACERLIELALRAGGPDNVTVIVADVEDDTDGAGPSDTVIGGAADDSEVSAEVLEATEGIALTAAQRAARLSPRSKTEGLLRRAPRGPGRRVALVLFAAVVVAALAVGGIWIFTQRQYYVGKTGAPATVAIYRGVPGAIFGVDLSHVDYTTNIPYSVLPQDDQGRVDNAIMASSFAQAETKVDTLRSDACPTAATTTGAVKHKAHKPPTHSQKAPKPLPAWCTS